jgi:hypothetical protein
MKPGESFLAQPLAMPDQPWYNGRMDEENYYEYDPYERSDDYNVFEENCIFEDREWESEQEEWLEQAGEMMMEQLLLPEE